MSYTRVNWKNKSQSPTTPLSAENLNIMDSGIANLDRDVTDILENKLAPATKTKAGIVKPDGVTTKVLSDGTIVSINGGGGGASVAAQVAFNDSVAELGADNVQDAIDNFKSAFDEQKDKGYLESRNLFDYNNTKQGSYAEISNRALQVFDLTGEYTFSHSGGNVATITYRVWDKVNNQWVDSASSPIGTGFTVNLATNHVLCMWGYNGFTVAQFNSAIPNAQLEKGSSATPYQPFTRSNAELTEKVDTYESKGFLGGNLYDINNVKAKTTWNNTSNNNWSVYFCKVEVGKTYSVKAFEQGESERGQLVTLDNIGATSYGKVQNFNTDGTITSIVADKPILAVAIGYGTKEGTIERARLTKIQLEEGSSISSIYLPYGGKSNVQLTEEVTWKTLEAKATSTAIASVTLPSDWKEAVVFAINAHTVLTYHVFKDVLVDNSAYMINGGYMNSYRAFAQVNVEGNTFTLPYLYAGATDTNVTNNSNTKLVVKYK